jgi:hypothetical protein
MISQTDIDDWDATQPERLKAVNHLGWGVEVFQYPVGWRWCSRMFPTKDEALEELMSYWKPFWPQYEFRVYEQLKDKE